MTIRITNSVAAGVIALGMLAAAGQAAAEPGLPLEQPTSTAPGAAPVDDSGTGSSAALTKLLLSMSAGTSCPNPYGCNGH
ncbi:hypothetical protein ABZ942_29125 [Nocardia sp. NPDC046473]|uniref:hypothetical protein n=1 Tax=Nocardia sp. NPDC046473 TaxID=3155733 RepID=UPI0033C00687